jgi:hypothetical protein
MSLRDLFTRSRDGLRWAWDHRPRGWVTPTSVAVGLVIAAFAMWFSDLLGERTTLGTIVVGSPAIYTRERLVNDRFLQDAWLSSQLDPTSAIQDSRQFRKEGREFGLRAGDSKAPSGSSEGSGQTSQKPESADGPRLSSRVLFLEAVDYREVVRSLTIENQLDDRHDLNGNSLYRFKFDASVLPGANTQASALIRVRLLSPPFVASLSKRANIKSLASLGTPEDVQAWRRIYVRWIDNLQSRLNQTHRELKQAYHSSEFSHNDYAQLIAFLVRNLRLEDRVPKCAAVMVDAQGAERLAAQLSTAEHVARKQCVDAIVEHTISQSAVVNLPPTATLGAYIQPTAGSKEAKKPTEVDKARSTRETVEVWLNSFVAGKTVKLVLGLVVPETSFVGRQFYSIPAFRNLARLTFFNGNTDAKDGDVFEVAERVFSVVAIDPAAVSKDDMIRLGKARQEFQDQTLADFMPIGAPKPLRFHVLTRQLETVKGDDIEFTEGDFRNVSSENGVYQASAEVGLLNFVRAARENVLAFTYGVTPRESADSVDLTLSSGAQLEGQAGTAADQSAGAAKVRREVTSRTLERRNAVVGFAGIGGDDSRDAEFGWVISPRLTSLDGLRHAYVQMPAQYALSALVSIPSWWNKAEFRVTTSWVGKSGAPIRGTSGSSKYVVDVPMDFEPLEALLLGIEQLGPELMESRLDPILLTACRSGAIIIPGRRLWRSTKVTLGYQTADAISVLPNMKGIIARFGKVENQISVDEEMSQRKKYGDKVEIRRAVRVWTSQGSLTLPQPARIGVPAGTPPNCEATVSPKSEASAEKSVTQKAPAPGK